MGNGVSQLTEEQLNELKENTGFDERTIGKIIKRYTQYDKSEKGTTGMTLRDVASIPEFTGHTMVLPLAKHYMDRAENRLFPENFIYFIAALSSKGTLELKRELAFKVFDINVKGYLDYPDVYRIYNTFFEGALSRDQILTLTHRLLQQPMLTELGKITLDDFNNLVPDWEILQKLTVDLQNFTE